MLAILFPVKRQRARTLKIKQRKKRRTRKILRRSFARMSTSGNEFAGNSGKRTGKMRKAYRNFDEQNKSSEIN
jgi:hypothetical protein